jgi:hypothetical protein
LLFYHEAMVSPSQRDRWTAVVVDLATRPSHKGRVPTFAFTVDGIFAAEVVDRPLGELARLE